MEFILKLLTLFTAFHSGLLYTYDDEHRLMKYLFNESRYNKYIRPLHNQLNKIQVNLSHTMFDIADFEVSKKRVIIGGYIEAKWYDEMLTWNPSDFGGLIYISLPEEVFWKPCLVMYRPSNELYILYERPLGVPAVLTYNGEVTTLPNANFDVTCTADTTLYPFDSHVCHFHIVPSKYQSSKMILHSTYSHVDTHMYVENNEWYLKDTSATAVLLEQDNAQYSVYRFTSQCTLERRVKFKLIHDFLPTGWLIVINLVSFAIPLNSGERLGFSITSYLAFIFLSDSVLEELPRNSLQISVSSYIYMTINIMNSLTVIWSAVAVRLSTIDSIVTPIPNYLMQFTLWMKRNHMSFMKKTKIFVEPERKEEEEIGTENSIEQSTTVSNSKEYYIANCSWYEVATELDTFVFRVMAFIFVVLILFAICYLAAKGVL